LQFIGMCVKERLNIWFKKYLFYRIFKMYVKNILKILI
jgi:hypothetical protein